MIRFAFSKHHSNTQGEYIRKRHDWRERGSKRERKRTKERVQVHVTESQLENASKQLLS